MPPIRIGVIGTGRIGQVHARNVAFRVPGAELAAVADPDEGAARSCGQVCRADWTTDYRRILDDPSVRGVVVASPTDTHARIVEEAAAAGKDVFCEKPIDLDLGRVDSALSAVERAGVRLQVGFNRRFDPSFRRAREAVAAGRIGKPHLLRLTSRDPRPPSPEYLAASGGLFTDMMIHDFDTARWLLADEVVAVSATGAVLVDSEIGRLGDVDTAIVMLRFARGALGSIDNSRHASYGYDVRVEVFGSEGAVMVGNLAPTATQVLTGEGVRGDPPLHWFIERFEEAYVAEMSEFVACIREDRAPAVIGHDGRVPLVLADAARQALRERREIPLA